MNKKETRKYIYYALVLVYVFGCAFYIFSLFNINQQYKNLEMNHVGTVRNRIYEVLEKSDSTKTLEVEFNQFVKEEAVEIIVIKNEEVLYTTFPTIEITNVRNAINEKVALFKAEEKGTLKNGQEVRLLYVIYRPTIDVFFKHFFIRSTILMILLFILAYIIFLFLQYTAYKPLNNIRKTLKKLREDTYSIGTTESNDAISKEFANFVQRIKEKDIKYQDEYTELEVLLLFEKQRLTYTLEKLQADIHELKTPIHQQLLENQIIQENLKPENKLANAILEYNILKNSKIILNVNELLQVVRSYETEKKPLIESFDYIELIDETINEFDFYFEKRDLLIDVTVPEECFVKMNKAVSRLIIHNLLSNAVKYAISSTEITLSLDKDDTTIYFTLENELSDLNTQRIKKYEGDQAFQELELDNNEEHRYAGGNGIRLVRKLLHAIDGEMTIEYSENGRVKIHLEVPYEKV